MLHTVQLTENILTLKYAVDSALSDCISRVAALRVTFAGDDNNNSTAVLTVANLVIIFCVQQLDMFAVACKTKKSVSVPRLAEDQRSLYDTLCDCLQREMAGLSGAMDDASSGRYVTVYMELVRCQRHRLYAVINPLLQNKCMSL